MPTETTTVPAAENRNRWLTAVAALAVGAAFFSLWFRLLPQWLGFNDAQTLVRPFPTGTRWQMHIDSIQVLRREFH
jgi:hypothetical protein